MRALTFVLPSGTVIDTAAADAERALRRGRAGARRRPARRSATRSAPTRELSERIRRKFEIKNTTGYRLCAFLDADEPLEIFRRLLVGSEGTLGFVAEAVFETVPLPRRTTTAWVHFAEHRRGDRAGPATWSPPARRAVELMVAPALIVAAHNIRGTPEDWKELPPESAVLLVEFGADDDAELDGRRRRARRRCSPATS